jgi:predicted GNAT superfamily acetyltransferase
VAVGHDYRRQGLATRLYQSVCELADDDFKILTCEVNLDPPNPTSVSFHEGFGFREVGRQWANGKHVSMMALDL